VQEVLDVSKRGKAAIGPRDSAIGITCRNISIATGITIGIGCNRPRCQEMWHPHR
jgi:hypothetical protein